LLEDELAPEEVNTEPDLFLAVIPPSFDEGRTVIGAE
jgi:hypothetical protein